MRSRCAILAVFCCSLLVACAAAQTPSAALRSAVPLLCTETTFATRTRVRGTGVIVDSGGSVLTAAHVILQAHSNCTLSVMIPDDEWSRIRRLRAFLVSTCRLNRLLDLAICRIRPAENMRDWGYISPARFGRRSPVSGEPVSITAFAGWGLFPLTRTGHIKGRENYQRPDGCHCNFAIDIAAMEGMSGSPVISAQGEVLGIVTLAGKDKFRGISFGVSLEEAEDFLRTEGVLSQPPTALAHSSR